VRHFVGMGNGLDALHASLLALRPRFGPRNQVITTPVTAFATTLAILQAGLEPVFADIDPATGNIDLGEVERKIGPRTAALLPVHLYGRDFGVEKLRKLSAAAEVPFIEDAAQAAGTRIGSAMAGTLGSTGCFSFYPTKNLGTMGDGGGVATDDDAVAARIRSIRNYGEASKYRHAEIGLNSRLDEIHAAILRERLKTLDLDNARRRQIARSYCARLTGARVRVPEFDPSSNYHLFPVLSTDRDRLKQHLADLGIQALVHYPELIPEQPALGGRFGSDPLPHAKAWVSQVLSLPLRPNLDDVDVDALIDAVLSFR
jgi:dTDP-4-amino-4,6-dideoxygalactose transaminase